MSRFKKSSVVKLALIFSFLAGSANHALALDVTVPVPAGDPLIEAAVTEVIATGEVTTMRNNVRTEQIALQAPNRPMQGEMMPRMAVVMQQRMRDQIMPTMQQQLSDPNNPDGMWTLFAPPAWQ